MFASSQNLPSKQSLDPYGEGLLHEIENFQSQLENFGSEIENTIKVLFQDVLNNSNACLTFTGSEGRSEKAKTHTSEIELILLLDDDNSADVINRVTAIIQGNPNLFYHNLQIKNLRDKDLIIFPAQNKKMELEKRVIPTRILDAKYVAGSPEIYQKAKTLFFEELRNPENLKAIKKFSKTLVDPSVSVLARVRNGREPDNIDLELGVIHYDGDRIKGTKFSVLRPVQYKLAEKIINLIQNGRLSKENFLCMPYSTCERIQWLVDQKMLEIGTTDLISLRHAYIQSLRWYSKSKSAYEDHQQTRLDFPKREMNEVVGIIEFFCKSKKIFNLESSKVLKITFSEELKQAQLKKAGQGKPKRKSRAVKSTTRTSQAQPSSILKDLSLNIK